MGVSSASEEFQHALQGALMDLVGVRNLADDIIVLGMNKKEHDKQLKKLCERLKACGLRCTPSNCEMGVTELTFYGLRLSKEGVAQGDDKNQALVNAGNPETMSDLNSFLELAVYANN